MKNEKWKTYNESYYQEYLAADWGVSLNYEITYSH
jgi:hypothetical protein